MLIPCSTITFTAENGQSFDRVLPAYYAKAFARVWAGRFQPDKLVVTDLPDDLPDSLRYMEVLDVRAAEVALESFFTAGDEQRSGFARALLAELFPSGLKGEIELLMRKDFERAVAAKRRSKIAATPHKSFLDLGLSATQACAFQGKGYPTAAELPEDLVLLAEVAGTPTQAMDLLEKLKTTRTPKASKPV